MTRYATAALLLLGLSQPAQAQLANFSTRATAMGDGYTASARGYEAIGWNPALLAMTGRPKFSFNIVQVGAGLGSNTFGVGDFNTYRDKFLTTADKQTLLDRVRQGDPNRTLSIDTRVGVSSLSLTVGNFGISASAAGEVGADVSSDAVELALFGNVTRKAPGQTYKGQGSGVRGWGAATVAFSYAAKLPVPVGALSVGATLKLNRGIAAVRGTDLGTSLQTSPNFDATVGFHALVTDVDSGGTNNGNGVGLDMGGAYQLASGLRFGLVLENLVNAQSWSDNNLVYYRKVFRIRQIADQLTDTTISNIERVSYNASDPMQKSLHDSLTTGGTFPMRIRVGVNLERGKLTLAGGATIRAKQALDLGAAQQLSGGVELRLIPVLPLRAGISSDLAGGFTFAGGFGLKFGPVRIDWAGANSTSGAHKGFQVAVGMSVMP